MSRDKFDYGVYKQKENYWLIQFYNPISYEKEYITSSNDYKKACNIYSKHQFEFYLDHRYLLPKNISVDTKRCKFIYSVQFEGRTIISKGFDTIQLASKYRDSLLSRILE